MGELLKPVTERLPPPGEPATGHGAAITLALCAASALMEGFDTQAMGVVAPRVAAEFGLSAAYSGLIFSAATFGLFLGAASGGRLADHFGRKRALVGSLGVFGLCSLLTAASSSAEFLLVARLLTGLGLGGAMPNFIALASEATRAERRVSAVTLVMAAMPMGGATAALLALGAQLGWGWRSIFIVGGTAPICLAVLIARVLPQAHRAGRGAAPPGVPRVAPVGEVLFGSARGATTALLWISFFFTQLVLLLMLNWLPSLIVGLGFSRTDASWASICFNLSGSLGAALLGRSHAGRRRRAWVIATYAGMAVSLGAVSAVGTRFALVAAACAVCGVFIIGAQLVLFALAPLYYPFAVRGTGVGAAVAAGRLGSVVGPLFAGGLLATGSASSTVLLAIVPFVVIGGAAAYALTWRPQVAS